MGKGYRPEMAQTLFSDKSNNSVTSQRRTERLLPGPACGREWAHHYTTLGPPCLQPSCVFYLPQVGDCALNITGALRVFVGLELN